MTIQKILLHYKPQKKNLLPAIKSINEKMGWISDEVVGKIARYFEVSEAHVFSVASFYDEINTQKPALMTIEICDGANCQIKNASKIISSVENFLKIKSGDCSKRFCLKRMSCVGRCLEGPVVKFRGVFYTKMTADKVIKLIENL